MRRFALIAALAVLAPAASARAEDEVPATTQAAQHHFESGVKFYEAGDYESARIEFEAGFRLSKLPDFLVNLCKVAERQNRPEDAVRYCEQYQKLRPDDEDVRQRLERLRGGVAKTGGPANRTSPPAQTISVPSVSPALSLPATQSKARQPVPKPPLGLLIGGSALLVVGIGTGAAALATQRQTESGPFFDDLDPLQKRGKALNMVAISLSVFGGAAVVAGGTWLGYWATHRAVGKFQESRMDL